MGADSGSMAGWPGFAAWLDPAERKVRLPRWPGLDAPVLARAFHRWRVAEGWVPLVQLVAPTAEELRWGRALASGGLLHVVGRDVAPPHDGWALVPGAEEAPPGAALVEEMLALDDWHAIAVDPTLARQRAALLAHVRRGEVVHVEGAPGSGRSSLAGWAFAAAGSGPVATIEPGRALPVHMAGPLLLRDADRLDDAALAALRARLPAGRAVRAATGAGGRSEHPAFAGLIGSSAALCEALALAERFAPHPHPLLLLGETGTGKEPLARAIHDASGRAGRYVALDLSARSAGLVDDDLFGRAAGAFNDAKEARDGAFRRADRGTLFLDEIANLSWELQGKLLRVLEGGEVQPLGSDRVYRVDVRVLAATNVDLEAAVASGRFRRDLLERLGVPIRLPPLRDRGDDVARLAQHFLDPSGARSFTREALARLRAHSWPGNVRELRRQVGFAAVMADGAVGVEHLGLPGDRPAAVVITTERGLESGGALSPRDVRAALALGIRVDGLAERGAVAVRNAVLAGLAGRAIAPAALARLEAWPWFGHHVELDRKLGALRAIAGPIDDGAVLELFPEMAQAAPRDAIVTLLYPTLRGADEPAGLRSAHEEGALLIGRIRRAPPFGSAPADDAERRLRSWLDVAVGDAAVAALPFPHLPELSRAHVLVTRTGSGLAVQRAPRSKLAVFARPLSGPAVEVAEGAAIGLGPAGEVRIERDGEAYLQLYVFLGAAAAREHLAALVGGDSGPPAETAPTENDRQRAWALDAAEIAVLNAAMLAFLREGGPFATSLRRSLTASREPAAKALAGYLLGPNPSQSANRLYKWEGNARLRADLFSAVASAGLLEAARERLPARVAECLSAPRLAVAGDEG